MKLDLGPAQKLSLYVSETADLSLFSNSLSITVIVNQLCPKFASISLYSALFEETVICCDVQNHCVHQG